jgi:tetratricopeptide (TPR) repeat protein
MLGAASRYFAATGCRPHFDGLTFACIGKKTVDARPVRSGNIVFLRNSPAYAVFDSSVFTSSANNVWLQETARAYAFDTPDSSYWFNESWAGYLSTRFFFAWSDTTDRLQYLERSRLLAHALDFFPTYPIAAGRTSRLNEDAVFLYKGRYVFMMLEYILGTDTFDSVMREVYARSIIVPPGIGVLQSLCESAYGSSLSWFFDQWLYRTGFPEYILTSQIDATPRGTYDVTVTVAQRGDIFTMPLGIHIETAGRKIVKRIFMKDGLQRFSYILPSMPTKVDWDPLYPILRWIPQYRILSYRVFLRDLALSEKEAQLTLQLDPDNNVGANSIALFSLGKAAGARKDWVKAEEYFLLAAQQRDPDEYPFFPLLSVVRCANILDLQGSRDKAVAEYRRALESAERNPLVYSPVIMEAARFLEAPFVQDDAVWYDYY